MAVAKNGTPSGTYLSATGTLTASYGALPLTPGDLLVCVLGLGDNLASGPPAAPTGWTLAENITNATNGSQGFYWRACTGADPQWSASLTFSTGTAQACVYEFSGASVTVPFQTNYWNTGTGTTSAAVTSGADPSVSGAYSLLCATVINSATEATTCSFSNSFVQDYGQSNTVKGHAYFGSLANPTTATTTTCTATFSITSSPESQGLIGLVLPGTSPNPSGGPQGSLPGPAASSYYFNWEKKKQPVLYDQPLGTTPVLLVNTFEEGTNGTTITTTNSLGGGSNPSAAFDTVNASGTYEFSNTNVMHGALSCEISTSADSCFGAWGSQLGSGHNLLYFRTYLYFTALPATANPRIISFFTSSSESGFVEALDLTLSGLIHSEAAGSGGSVTLSTSTWYRLEGFVNVVAGISQVNYYLGDSTTSLGQDNFSASFAPMGSIAFGPVGGSSVWTGWIDDIGVSNTGFLGPSGVTVTGVPATVSVNGVAGATKGNANVSGVVATVSVAGVAGTLKGNANVSGVAATIAVNGIAGTATGVSSIAPSPADAAMPGPAWLNRFKQVARQRHGVLYDYQLTFAGSYLTAGDLAFGATTSGFQLPYPGVPDTLPPPPPWQNQFRAYLGKQAVLFDYQLTYSAHYLTAGDIAFGATALGAQSFLTVNSDPAAAMPGPAWTNYFRVNGLTKQSILFDTQGAFGFTGVYDNPSGDITFGATAIGIQFFRSDPPAAMPGPAWMNRYRGQNGKNVILFDSQRSIRGPYCFVPSTTILLAELGGSATLVSLDATDGGTATDTNLEGGTATDVNAGLGGSESNDTLGGSEADTNEYGGFLFGGCYD